MEARGALAIAVALVLLAPSAGAILAPLPTRLTLAIPSLARVNNPMSIAGIAENVVADRGVPMGAATVVVRTASGGALTTAKTDESGNYATSFVPTGRGAVSLVASVDDVRGRAQSPVRNATVADLPGAPTALTAAPSQGRVDLQWSAPADDGGAPILRYRVWRAPNGASFSLIATPTTPSYVDTAASNVDLAYAVSAMNGLGEGGRTQVAVYAKPTAPTALVVANASNGIDLDVSWSPPASDGGLPLLGYRLRRAVGSESLQVVAQSMERDFVDVAPPPYRDITFSVTAFNAKGEGPSSSATILRDDGRFDLDPPDVGVGMDVLQVEVCSLTCTNVTEGANITSPHATVVFRVHSVTTTFSVSRGHPYANVTVYHRDSVWSHTVGYPQSVTDEVVGMTSIDGLWDRQSGPIAIRLDASPSSCLDLRSESASASHSASAVEGFEFSMCYVPP